MSDVKPGQLRSWDYTTSRSGNVFLVLERDPGGPQRWTILDIGKNELDWHFEIVIKEGSTLLSEAEDE